MSGEINEDVVEDPFHQVKGRTVPIDLHREIMKLARLVELESLLSEDSAVDDYAVVIDEATHRLERLLASPPSAQEVAHAKAAKLTKEDQKILSKSKQYEDELLQSLKQIDQRDEWYEKYKRLAVKLQKQKSQQGVLEEFVQSQNKKIAVLVDHVDKLMKAVKLENTKRMKVIDDARKMQREEDALRSKIERQSKVILTQQRAIRELSEGSKVLEDQLKLMDEKFLELRSKLDVTRENLAKQIKAAKKESFELRTKYAAITQGGSLDKVRLPESSNGGTWPMNRTTNSDSRPGSGTLSPEQIVSGEFTRPAPIDVNRMPAADLDAMQSVRQHRSKSVDFIPQAMSLPQSPHRLSVSVRHSQPLQVQQNFLVGLKSNVPTEASRSQQSVGSPAHRQISPPPATGSRPQSASAPSPNVRASTNSASGYGSGGNQISNGIASSHRPRSAVPFQDTKSRTATATSSRAFNERILTHVVRKIDRKSGKRSGWTADRMLELLG